MNKDVKFIYLEHGTKNLGHQPGGGGGGGGLGYKKGGDARRLA